MTTDRLSRHIAPFNLHYREVVNQRGANIALLIAAIATTFDGISSYLLIKVWGFAEEGNAWLVLLGEQVGFGGAMVIRVALGLLLLQALHSMTYIPGREGHSARVGMVFIAIIYILLTGYHILGIVLWGVA